jgi:integrase
MRFQSVKDWTAGLNSKNSRTVYLGSFQQFMAWLHRQAGYEGASPDSLIAMRRADLKSDDVKQRRRFEALLKRYYADVREQHGKAYWTSSNKLKAVRSFFSGNFLPVTYRRGELRVVQANKEEKRFPRTADVGAWCRRLESWRDRAMFLLMFQSGPTPVDVCAVRYGEIKDKLSQDPPVLFRYVRQKTGIEAKTCLHADTLYALRMMLENRGGLGDEDFVFVGRNGKPLTPHVVWQVFQNGVGGGYSPKDLRDSFKHYLREARVDKEVQDWMMGHEGSAGGRYGVSDEAVLDGYGRVAPLVSVDGGAHTQSADEVGELRRQVEELRAEMGRINDSIEAHSFFRADKVLEARRKMANAEQ